jgi:hypothetical protein
MPGAGFIAAPPPRARPLPPPAPPIPTGARFDPMWDELRDLSDTRHVIVSHGSGCVSGSTEALCNLRH